jgi:hypothetical protein
VRLDEKPELFFTLRGIKVQDFVGTMVKRESKKILRKAKQKSVRAIATDDAEVSALFGITMESATGPANAVSAPSPRKKKAKAGSKKIARVGAEKRGMASGRIWAKKAGARKAKAR